MNDLRTAPSGRKYYRHESGLGSVMLCNLNSNGILVLDAKYRSVQKFGTYGTDTTLTNYTSTPKSYLHLSNTSTNTQIASTITDDWIDSNIVKDENTSKQNCDIWMNYESKMDNYGIQGVPAVAYCRKLFLDNMTFDLPNIQTLARIYCDAIMIDYMDPTVSESPSTALTNWFSGTSYVWSSTEYNSYYCWIVYTNDSVYHYGYKSGSYGVLPILEL